MPSPVRLSQFRSAISAVTGTLCDKFYALLGESGLFYNWFSYVFKESGAFTDEFIADVCGLDCICPESSTFGAPHLLATYDTDANKIVVSWSEIPKAVRYQIKRYTTNPDTDPSAIMEQMYDTADLYWNDTTPSAGVAKYYRGLSVQADLTTTSGEGAVVVGRRGSGATLPSVPIASIAERANAYVKINISVTGALTFAAANATGFEIWIAKNTSGYDKIRLGGMALDGTATSYQATVYASVMPSSYRGQPANLFVRFMNTNVGSVFVAVTGNPWNVDTET